MHEGRSLADTSASTPSSANTFANSVRVARLIQHAVQRTQPTIQCLGNKTNTDLLSSENKRPLKKADARARGWASSPLPRGEPPSQPHSPEWLPPALQHPAAGSSSQPAPILNAKSRAELHRGTSTSLAIAQSRAQAPRFLLRHSLVPVC